MRWASDPVLDREPERGREGENEAYGLGIWWAYRISNIGMTDDSSLILMLILGVYKKIFLFWGNI